MESNVCENIDNSALELHQKNNDAIEAFTLDSNITNTKIDLSKDSLERQNAINTIKYTLLLKYSVPSYAEDISFIDDILKQCRDTCFKLFPYHSNGKEQFMELPNYFFGLNVNGRYPDFLKNAGCHAPLNKESIFISDSDPYPYFSDMILQHCILSSYHAISTDLSSDKLTAYKICQDSHFRYKNHEPLTNFEKMLAQKKCSLASNMQTKINTHMKVLPLSNELREQDIFSELWYDVCLTNTARFKHLYLNKINRPDSFLNNLIYISEHITPDYVNRESSTQQSKADFLHHMYIIERIFPIRLFYTLLQNIISVHDNTIYRLVQKDYFTALSSVASLPNVFSRQIMLTYAMFYIDSNTASNRNYWSINTLAKDNTICESTRNDPRDFNLAVWGKQLSLFTRYLSEYIIPIYEWCFTCMLLDSIETHYKSWSHQQVLEKAKQLLGDYMEEHCNEILYPYKLNPSDTNRIPRNMIDLLTPMDEDIAYHIGLHLSKKELCTLLEIFFPKQPSFDLNFSTSLNPDFFRQNNGGYANPPLDRLQKFYIDLLRYDHWELSD